MDWGPEMLCELGTCIVYKADCELRAAFLPLCSLVLDQCAQLAHIPDAVSSLP